MTAVSGAVQFRYGEDQQMNGDYPVAYISTLQRKDSRGISNVTATT